MKMSSKFSYRCFMNVDINVFMNVQINVHIIFHIDLHMNVHEIVTKIISAQKVWIPQRFLKILVDFSLTT